MKNVAEEVFVDCERETLHLFFLECQKIAKEKKRDQVGSIILGIEEVDPLKVLDLLKDSNDKYFYFEHPENDFAIVGIGAIIEGAFEGEKRFAEVRNFAKQWMENTILARNTTNENCDGMNVGPHFFTSFTFDEEPKNSQIDERLSRSFPAACVFLGGCQIMRKGSRSLIMANRVIGIETNVDIMAEEIRETYLKILGLKNNKPLFQTERKNQQIRSKETGGTEWYEEALTRIIESLKCGSLEKVVVARAIDIESDRVFDPLSMINRLRTVYPLCYSCLIGNGRGQHFICATPERLVKIENKKIFTAALAGTAPRGISEMEDQALEQDLLRSEKNVVEHQFVVECIVDSLMCIGLNAKYNKDHLEVKKLANVQHLYTAIEAEINGDIHLLDVAATLHPTAAVCGIPAKISREVINSFEPFNRELYTGVIGFFDFQGQGEMVVGIRCALIDGAKARLYAGGGIVQESNIMSERKETDLKFQVILGNLL